MLRDILVCCLQSIIHVVDAVLVPETDALELALQSGAGADIVGNEVVVEPITVAG